MNVLTALPTLGLPRITGLIDRRILVNFRCAPSALAPILPPPFRPKLVRGCAMVGLCVIRLRHIRPTWLPEWIGLASENVAHRVAVEWDEAGQKREGVFVIRRDTDSNLNVAAGGRLFPGIHHRADFEVWESPLRYKIAMRSRSDGTFVRLAARVEDGDLAGSIFRSLQEASDFFSAGSLGWSLGQTTGGLEGLELATKAWRVTPLMLERVETSYFQNPALFPPGAIQLDSALLMRDIPHEWRPHRWAGNGETQP